MIRSALLIAALAGVANAYCPNSCSGHGDCGDNDKCICQSMWTTQDCSQRECPYGISWTTLSKNELKTQSYLTPNSDTSKSILSGGMHPYVECSNKGVCDRSTGECKCFPGYGGKGCRRSECPKGCSGHGICVLGASYNTNYGRDGRLQFEKAYWNGKKSQTCRCDSGWQGTDCSLRMCPLGIATESGCNSETTSATDVQIITLTHKKFFKDASKVGTSTDILTKVDDLEQFFTLQYTDEFNRQYTTKPISYWANELEIKQALVGLPNFMISEDIEVRKIYPLNQYYQFAHASGTSGRPTPLESIEKVTRNNLGTKARTFNKDGLFRCEQIYYEYTAHTGCNSDSDCTKMTGLAGSNVKCLQIGSASSEAGASGILDKVCVEVSSNALQKDFTADDGSTFGRRVTPNDVSCHMGDFDNDDVFAVTCTTNDDCLKCGGDMDVTGPSYTNIRAGVCDTVTKKCSWTGNSATTTLKGGPDRRSKRDGYLMDSKCMYASIIVKFIGHSGRQNTLKINTGDKYTNHRGASPKFESEGLWADKVIHAAVADVRNADKSFKSLQYKVGATDNLVRVSLTNTPDITCRNFEGATTSATPQLCNTAFAFDPKATKSCPSTSDPHTRCTGLKLNDVINDQRGWVSRNKNERDTALINMIPFTGTATKMKLSNNVDARGTTFYRASIKTCTTQEGCTAAAAKTDDTQTYPESETGSANAEFKTLFPCSSNGQCDTDTGTCVCNSEYSGESCQTKIATV